MNSKVLITITAMITIAVSTRAADPAPASPPKAAEAAAPAKPADEVVARVNGKAINRSELDMATKAVRMQVERSGRPMPAEQMAKMETDVLDEIISRELVLEAGLTKPPTNLNELVTKQMDAIKAQIGGDKELGEALKESGITVKDYTDRLRDNIIIQELMKQIVDQRAKVTEEEIKDFYSKNTKEFEMPESARASHILIRVAKDATDADKAASKAKIEAARSLVKNGEKFADVAKKYSEDPGSKDNGGDLGLFPKGMMVPQFDEVVFTIPTNTLSEVVTTPFGYHVIIVAERKPAGLAPLDEVKGNLERYLQMQKGQKVAMEYAKELRSKAKVEVFIKPPPAPAPAAAAVKPAVTVETPAVAAPAK